MPFDGEFFNHCRVGIPAKQIVTGAGMRLFTHRNDGVDQDQRGGLRRSPVFHAVACYKVAACRAAPERPAAVLQLPFFGVCKNLRDCLFQIFLRMGIPRFLLCAVIDNNRMISAFVQRFGKRFSFHEGANHVISASRADYGKGVLFTVSDQVRLQAVAVWLPIVINSLQFLIKLHLL